MLKATPRLDVSAATATLERQERAREAGDHARAERCAAERCQGSPFQKPDEAGDPTSEGTGENHGHDMSGPLAEISLNPQFLFGWTRRP